MKCLHIVDGEYEVAKNGRMFSRPAGGSCGSVIRDLREHKTAECRVRRLHISVTTAGPFRLIVYMKSDNILRQREN